MRKKITVGVTVAASVAGLLTLAPAVGVQAADTPAAKSVAADPPKLPKNFKGRGYYVVPSLGKHGTKVPFWWNGRDGNFRMVAGGPKYKIWFTNALINGNFYTYTYHWPHIPSVPCQPIPGGSRNSFNQFLAHQAHLVGPEILLTPQSREVDHWRVASALTPIDEVPLRFPLAQADIYVDSQDARIWRQVLHYGYQNLYAKELDEWMVLDTWKLKPGKVKLPGVCKKA